MKHLPKSVSDIVKKAEETQAEAQKDVEAYFRFIEDVTSAESRKDTLKKAKGIPDLVAVVRPDYSDAETDKEASEANMSFKVPFKGKVLDLKGSDLLVWAQTTGDVTDVLTAPGKSVVNGEKLVDVYSARTGGLYYYIQMGVLLEIFPPLIFLGVGALTDFGPLIARPKTLLLGGAAQFGVFATFIGAIYLGFTSQEAASIGIIGGADGPTSIFITNKLAPHLLAPIAVAAYSYMALVPIIQPPIMRLLTTEKERKIRMKSLRKVSRLEKLIFALVVTIFCILLVPDVSALVAMLMLGNFLRECGVCERLSKAAQNELINVVTIFLGTSVGITMTGDRFLRVNTRLGRCRLRLLHGSGRNHGENHEPLWRRQGQSSNWLGGRVGCSDGGARIADRRAKGGPDKLPAHARHGTECCGRHRHCPRCGILYCNNRTLIGNTGACPARVRPFLFPVRSTQNSILLFRRRRQSGAFFIRS